MNVLDRWIKIETEMYSIQSAVKVWDFRRRYNPHHSKEQVEQEKRTLMADLYYRLCNVKADYETNKKELVEFLDEGLDTKKKYGDLADILDSLLEQDYENSLEQVFKPKRKRKKKC